MTKRKADNYIRACLKAWMFCETCIRAELRYRLSGDDLMKKCRECAHACFTVVCNLINKSAGVPEAALQCILYCRECVEECEKNPNAYDNILCAETCRHCAETMRTLIVPQQLN